MDVDPQILEKHYLSAGRVDTLVDRILENERTASPQMLDELCAVDLVEEPERSDRPKPVNPACGSVVFSAVAHAAMLLCLPLVLALRRLLGPWFLIAVGGLMAAVVLRETFEILGRRHGGSRLKRLAGVTIGLLTVVGLGALVYCAVR